MTEHTANLWMVVRMDIHGTNYIMRDGMAEEAAKRYLANLLSQQLKIHGQDYSIYSYRCSTRTALLAQLGVS